MKRVEEGPRSFDLRAGMRLLAVCARPLFPKEAAEQGRLAPPEKAQRLGLRSIPLLVVADEETKLEPTYAP